MERQATDKQINYLSSLVIFKVFQTEIEVLTRERIMEFLKRHNRPIEIASKYIGFCVDLDDRIFPKRRIDVEQIRRNKFGRIVEVDMLGSHTGSLSREMDRMTRRRDVG